MLCGYAYSDRRVVRERRNVGVARAGDRGAHRGVGAGAGLSRYDFSVSIR